MRQHHLPAVVVALLERLVPARGRAEVVGDLAEEYGGRRRAMGPVRARAWLWRQVALAADRHGFGMERHCPSCPHVPVDATCSWPSVPRFAIRWRRWVGDNAGRGPRRGRALGRAGPRAARSAGQRCARRGGAAPLRDRAGRAASSRGSRGPSGGASRNRWAAPPRCPLSGSSRRWSRPAPPVGRRWPRSSAPGTAR